MLVQQTVQQAWLQDLTWLAEFAEVLCQQEQKQQPREEDVQVTRSKWNHVNNAFSVRYNHPQQSKFRSEIVWFAPKDPAEFDTYWSSLVKNTVHIAGKHCEVHIEERRHWVHPSFPCHLLSGPMNHSAADLYFLQSSFDSWLGTWPYRVPVNGCSK